MSGYRSLHREKVGDYPIWKVASSPLLSKASSSIGGSKASPAWRLWAACGDGFVRGFFIQEKTLEAQKDVLDASACTCTCTHLLVGKSQDSGASSGIGCSQVQVARNYVGDDDKAGDLLVASMDLTGKIRIWSMNETMDDEVDWGHTSEAAAKLEHQKAVQEFEVENATGTSLLICPPKNSGVGDVVVAVPRLDGTIAIVATGISTPTAKTTKDAGSIADVWSKPGSIAISSDWHPSKRSLVVGRRDGLVEILGESPHRLVHHEAPVRSVQFMPDANLLITACDDGMVAVWDLGRPIPVLVNHALQAHTSWILNMTTLSDSRRFLTCGADRKLNVWTVGQMHQAMHTFTCDDTVWTVHACTTSQRNATTAASQRLISGSENGGLQIYSLEP